MRFLDPVIGHFGRSFPPWNNRSIRSRSLDWPIQSILSFIPNNLSTRRPPSAPLAKLTNHCFLRLEPVEPLPIFQSRLLVFPFPHIPFSEVEDIPSSLMPEITVRCSFPGQGPQKKDGSPHLRKRLRPLSATQAFPPSHLRTTVLPG